MQKATGCWCYTGTKGQINRLNIYSVKVIYLCEFGITDEMLKAIETDFLIIGQGAAGTLLAFSLLEQGARVHIVDAGLPSASAVAAGIMHTMALRIQKRIQYADTYFQTAEARYKKLEDMLGVSFYKRLPLHYFMQHSEEMLRWQRTCSEPDMLDVVMPAISNPHTWSNPSYSHVAPIIQAACVHTETFLQATQNYFIQRKMFTCSQVQQEDITLQTDGVKYRNIQAKKIVFCQGHYATENPWFGYLPYKSAKGEVLEIACELPDNAAYKSGLTVVPIGQGMFKCGSNFAWDILNFTPDIQMKIQMEEKLKNWLEIPFTIKKHLSGVRPTLKDRLPLAGLHHTYKQLGIFTGGGSRGLLIYPYLAHVFASQLCQQTETNMLASIHRFHTSKYIN